MFDSPESNLAWHEIHLFSLNGDNMYAEYRKYPFQCTRKHFTSFATKLFFILRHAIYILLRAECVIGMCSSI